MILKTIIPAVLNQIRSSATFLSIKGYKNNFDEISDFGCVFHVDYKKAVQKAVNIWHGFKPKDDYELQAKFSLVESYKQTLLGYNQNYKNAGVYEQISDGQSIIKSVKWHDNGKSIHFWGFEVHKQILRPGDYPPDTRAYQTIVRDKLLAMTQLSKFRQFVIAEGRFQSIGIEGLTLTQKDLLRELT